MSSFNVSPSNNVTAFANGSNVVAGVGSEWQLAVSGAWINGDEYTVTLTDSQTGIISQFGAGFATGIMPTFVVTYNQKVYTLSGPTVTTSAQNLPTTFNDPNAVGNGFVTMSDFWNIQENLEAVVPFQGRLAFFSHYSIQLWVVDPLISNWEQVQVLTNIGTMAPNSVQGLGDYDVLFLNDSGIRSLRVLATTLQGFINDIGSPIDDFIQGDLVQTGLANASNSVGVVDPLTRRYWMFLPNTQNQNSVGSIYVLSYYPANKISAWSTYDPSYVNSQGTSVFFTPQFFSIYKGQVWVRDTDNGVYQYGGVNNNTFDTTVATVALPFVDLKTPGNEKTFLALDLDVYNSEGMWTVFATTDWYDPIAYQDVTATGLGQATFDNGFININATGTHLSVMAQTSDPSAATLSSILIYYNVGSSPAGT